MVCVDFVWWEELNYIYMQRAEKAEKPEREAENNKKGVVASHIQLG